MIDPPGDEWAAMSPEEFVARARELLTRRVNACQVDTPGAGDDQEPISISADAYACEAARLMRMHDRAWLIVQGTGAGRPQYVTEDSLGHILDIVDASPYLGEAMMAAILPPMGEDARA